MAQALGIGGVFFKAQDPKALGEWYKTWLGIQIDPTFGGTAFLPSSMPPGGYTIWGPFAADTDYFEPCPNPYMINLIVDDVDEALTQVRAGGATLIGEPQQLEYGDFGWFLDPEGNKIELWRPADALPDA